MFFYTISLKGYKMNEKTIYRLFFSLFVIFLMIVTPYIFLISGPSFSILIPIVLIFILIFIIAFIKKNKKIYDFMLYILLFILSIIIFF